MASVKDNQKIQELYAELKKAGNQINSLTQQNTELQSLLIDKRVNEIRRIESFKLLGKLWGNADWNKESVKQANKRHILVQRIMIEQVDNMIEELADFAEEKRRAEEVAAESEKIVEKVENEKPE